MEGALPQVAAVQAQAAQGAASRGQLIAADEVEAPGCGQAQLLLLLL
jgi:hypothetical protein